MKINALGLFIFLIPILGYTQSIQWLKTYSIDTSSIGQIGIYSMGMDVTPTSDNGFIAVSREVYPNALSYQFIRATKTNREGEVEWSKIYPSNINFSANGLGWDEVSAVIEVENGNFLMAGAEMNFISGPGKGLLMKINAMGDTLWKKRYELGEDTRINSIKPISGGGYIITGFIENGDTLEAYISRLDENGNILWVEKDFLSEHTVAYDIAIVDKSKLGFVITGMVDDNIFALAMTLEGRKAWSKKYNFSPNDAAYSIRYDSEDGLLIAGSTEIDDQLHPLILKVDLNGNEVWKKTLVMPGHEATTIRLTPNGYLISGSFADIYKNLTENTGFLSKMDREGDPVSTLVLNQFDGMNASDHEVLEDGTIIVTGMTLDGFFLLRTGEITNNNNLILIDDVVDIFPQPAKHQITVKWRNAPSSAWRIELLNSNGQLLQAQKLRDSIKVFSIRDLPTGTYFYRIFTDKLLQTGKLIKQ